MQLISEKTESADVVIIGAGIAGISAAYYLAVKNGMRNVVSNQRVYALGIASLAVLGMVPIMLSLFAERFETLAILLQNPGLPFNDPGTFTYEDRQVMSGRAFIAS